ncbi:kinase-like domain-containing protein [Armillaria borealis]|uniref:Kinase-like domain-containing protein n=1 Tax=Armillaria borealis TaxID=47425 RepID=A0AA39JAF7_9AGAR|nr:kinase-like domain-containing protein [Armillaria borealis]
MKYLHNQNPPIVHADIRGANILVMDDLRCCLADFGLSLSSRMNKGSTRWLAPEYIDPKVAIDWAYITARDTYAYGCTIVEIFTGKPPFSEIKNEAAVIHAVMNGDHPLPPQHLPQDGLRSLVMACFTASPSQRPTAEQIPKVLADGDFLADCLSFRDGTLTRGNIDTIDAYNSTPNTYDSFSSGAQSDVSPAQPDFSSFLYPSPSETYSYDYSPRTSTIEYRSPASFIPETNPAMVDNTVDYYLSTNLPNEYLNDLMDFSFPQPGIGH